jgi:hypothetical protein
MAPLHPPVDPMSAPQSLQIHSGRASSQLRPDQKRFNSLLRQIEQARATLSAWQESITAYRQSHAQLLAPLQEQLGTLRREWLLALDHAPRRGWTRADQETASELLAAAAAELLSVHPDDVSLKELFARHAGTDFEEAQRESLHMFKDMAEAMTGLDLGEDEEIGSEEELIEKLHQQLRGREDAAAARETLKASRRKSAAQQRREAEAQQVTHSIREVYRKLASALHPDREQDPRERAAKTSQMAQVNDAYARGDLLALLELQLRIEQIDAEHLAQADERRLKHYNQVLSEQLQELRLEIETVQAGFQMDFHVVLDWRPDPTRLGKVLQGELARLREALATTQRELRLFADTAAIRRWLKDARRHRRHDHFDPDFF